MPPSHGLADPIVFESFSRLVLMHHGNIEIGAGRGKGREEMGRASAWAFNGWGTCDVEGEGGAEFPICQCSSRAEAVASF